MVQAIPMREGMAVYTWTHARWINSHNQANDSGRHNYEDQTNISLAGGQNVLVVTEKN